MTGLLTSHLTRCNKEFVHLKNEAKAKKDGTQFVHESIGGNMVQTRLDMFNPVEASSSSTYSEDVDREELAKMVVVIGLSFSFPLYPSFIHYIQ